MFLILILGKTIFFENLAVMKKAMIYNTNTFWAGLIKHVNHWLHKYGSSLDTNIQQ